MTDLSFKPLDLPATSTATEQVFETLYQAVVSLQLLPGAKISEAEIAGQLNVSRQPVRDAFFRLSKLGFLSIRPQRATLVTKISKTAVLQAAFVRTALEVACMTDAIERATQADIDALDALLKQQEQAVNDGQRAQFHARDDAFHRKLCEISGHAHVWQLIQEQKAHMDRVRFLSLTAGLSRAFDEHLQFFDAFKRRDKAEAEALLRDHLGVIRDHMQIIAAGKSQYFEDSTS